MPSSAQTKQTITYKVYFGLVMIMLILSVSAQQLIPWLPSPWLASILLVLAEIGYSYLLQWRGHAFVEDPLYQWPSTLAFLTAVSTGGAKFFTWFIVILMTISTIPNPMLIWNSRDQANFGALQAYIKVLWHKKLVILMLVFKFCATLTILPILLAFILIISSDPHTIQESIDPSKYYYLCGYSGVLGGYLLLRSYKCHACMTYFWTQFILWIGYLILLCCFGGVVYFEIF